MPHSGDSVVLNQVKIQLRNGQLHSCVLVPIGESEPIGFVIAVNQGKSNKSFPFTNGLIGGRGMPRVHFRLVIE